MSRRHGASGSERRFAESFASTDAGVKVSMIVCTRNRASRLPRFLSAIAALECVPFGWELVIVDHASTDDTDRTIRAFAASAAFPVRPLRAHARALSAAKNEAIAAARGEILAFTDDDCYPRADYLLALAAVFDAHDVGVVGGRVVRHDPTDANVSIRDVDTHASIEPGTFVRPGTVHGANLAVRREVLASIGGFDPLLGPGTPCVAAEDIELVARAIWAGWRGRYDPAPVVSHHHGRKPGAEADRVRRGYDYGRGAYYTKFLLNRQARRVYLRGWYEVTRRSPRAVARPRLFRELAGGRRYLVQRMLAAGAIRRVETAAELTHSHDVP
jgi:glycosyltransferase involved in cell wall biosynthesis